MDTAVFRPRDDRLFGSDRPVFLYVGRIAREKNIEAFLDLKLPGKKVVVGDGPHLATLQRKYQDAIFTGAKFGDELGRHYASADVFVFPSKSDTFGLVLLEAMSSGVPVAAFPVTGPIDLVRIGETGFLDHNLAAAAMRALSLDRAKARAYALNFSWAIAAEQFLANLTTAHEAALSARATERGFCPTNANSTTRGRARAVNQGDLA